MNEQRYDNRSDARGLGRVVPIYRLLGEGRLGPEAVDAMMAVLEAEGLPTVAAARLERASLIARSHPRPVEQAVPAAGILAPLRRLLATLVLDLNPLTAPAGVRGAALTGCRLLFAADGYEIVIQEAVDARRRARSLLGQVLQDGDPVLSATVLLVSGNGEAVAEADNEGSFRFHNVTSGSYTLDVRTGDDSIVCAPITLDEPSAGVVEARG